MITKVDILEHLKKMDGLETELADTYNYASHQVQDINHKKMFKHLAREEKTHKLLVEKLVALIKIA